MTEEKETYYQRNRDKCKAQAVAYQQANREKYKAYFKDYYLKNKDKLRANHKAYVERHKQTIYKNYREKYYPKNYAKQKQETLLTRPVVLDNLETTSKPCFTKEEGSFLIRFD